MSDWRPLTDAELDDYETRDSREEFLKASLIELRAAVPHPDGGAPPALDGFLPDVATVIAAARKILEDAERCCDTCHESVSDKIRPYLFRGAPPEPTEGASRPGHP
jgi:hypothetical protein